MCASGRIRAFRVRRASPVRLPTSAMPSWPAVTLSRHDPGSRAPTTKHCLTMSEKWTSLPPIVSSTTSVSAPTASIWGSMVRAQLKVTMVPPDSGNAYSAVTV